MSPPASEPAAPRAQPHVVERLVAKAVGGEARLGDDEPKRWEKRCSIQRACSPLAALGPCDPALTVRDSPANSNDGDGKTIALRGTLSLGPIVTTAMACEPKLRDPRRRCCNQLGTRAILQCGDASVGLDKLGCAGDESRLCCDAPAFGQTVVAFGKLRRFPAEPGGIEWQLDEPKLCLEAHEK